jgi:prepilin signal peptidase PulO-like enzyme (type II secretory pathway)
MNLFYFLLGAAIGSFLNVVALRYDPDRFLFSKSLGGRSHCPHCKKTLRWFELVPLVSFVAQRGRCLRCNARISFRYPLVELVSGLIFVFVPLRLVVIFPYLLPIAYCLLSAIWVLVFELLLLMALIDLRHFIIPDEVNILLGICGVAFAAFLAKAASTVSFTGNLAALFSVSQNPWITHGAGALFGFLLFGAIIAITRGRGMGMGDLKLAIPLGFLFGWPDIVMVAVCSFIIGAAYGVWVMAFRGKHLKSAVPFGPFLALGATLVFLFGYELASAYFSFFLM